MPDSDKDAYMPDSDKDEYNTWLDDPNTIIGEGEGRHDATKFKICSYYFKYSGEWLDLTDEQRFERAWQWHLAHCKPPRTREHFDDICKWVKEKKRVEKDKLHEDERERRQKNKQRIVEKMVKMKIKRKREMNQQQ